MQIRLNHISWSADQDIIRDSDGKDYQIMSIEQDRLGLLSLVLDTFSSIYDRLTCFQNISHDWMQEDKRGRVYPIEDENILAFLKELQATVPPLQIR